MHLRRLLYFSTLADTLNFHRAAKRLNISQPPLTVAIRKLEEELGAELFTRGPRGVSLTPAGEAALGPARATLARAREVKTAVQQGQQGKRGRLRIGFIGSAIYALLPRLIPLYRAHFPLVDLILEDSTSFDIAERLRARELDVGLVRLPLVDDRDIITTPVEGDEFAVALLSSSPLATAEQLSLATLADQPFIFHTRISILHTAALLACHEAGFAPKIAQEATQVHTILSLVQSGLGVALVPSKTASQLPKDVVLRPLRNPRRIQSGIATHIEADDPLIRNFVDLAASISDIEKIS